MNNAVSNQLQNNTQLVSVIVPIYNTEKYLDRCLISIVNQTYLNLEIILIDDGSQDDSIKVINRYANKDKRISVYRQENKGLSDVRNFGLSVAKGDYILFVDSDDFIELNLVESCLKLLTENSVDMVIFAYKYGDFESNNIDLNVYPKTGILNTKETIKYTITEQIQSYAWSRIAKKEVFKGITYPSRRNFEDTITTYKIILNCKSILVINEPFYNYYSHRSSSITNNYNSKNMEDCFAFRLERYRNIKKIYSDLDDYGTQLVINDLIHFALTLSYKDNKALKTEGEKIIKEDNYVFTKRLEKLFFKHNFLLYYGYKFKFIVRKIPFLYKFFKGKN